MKQTEIDKCIDIIVRLRYLTIDIFKDNLGVSYVTARKKLSYLYENKHIEKIDNVFIIYYPSNKYLTENKISYKTLSRSRIHRFLIFNSHFSKQKLLAESFYSLIERGLYPSTAEFAVIYQEKLSLVIVDEGEVSPRQLERSLTRRHKVPYYLINKVDHKKAGITNTWLDNASSFFVLTAKRQKWLNYLEKKPISLSKKINLKLIQIDYMI